MPVEITERYIRYRIRPPFLFKKGSFRTLDIGEEGKHKLIRAKLKKTGEYKTQAVLVEKRYAKQLESETKEIIKRARAE